MWRLCVSYRSLNSVTHGFEFPIPHYTDSIDEFGDSNGSICFISLDTRSGYHQVRVRKSDQENLAFFTPSSKNKTFKVIPFDPKNAPDFYITMMHILCEDWILFCKESKHTIVMTNSPSNIVCDDRIIIDGIV